VLSVGSRHPLKLELFPFISLFLCVIGVLAFLQNLFVLGDIGEAEEEASQPQIFHTAYRIETFADSLLLTPPIAPLDELLERLTLDEKTALNQVLERRDREAEQGGLVLPFNAEFDEETLRQVLNEVVTLNQLSVTMRHPYEEYLLFTVHSGGSDIYHYLRLLLDSPEYRHLRSGLEVVEAGSVQ